MKKATTILSLLIIAGMCFAIRPADGWTVGATGKYTQSVQANVTTEGGNVTNLNLSSNISTEKWAGYWGNLSGNIFLSPGVSMFYTWAWDSGSGGEVCAVTASSGFDWSNAQTIAAATVDTIWAFTGADTDSAANTLADSCSVTVAGTSIAGSVGTSTGTGGFQTCAVGDGDDTAKSDVAFCVNITQGGSLFNGQSGDYELLTATNETSGATETHYFWMELN